MKRRLLVILLAAGLGGCTAGAEHPQVPDAASLRGVVLGRQAGMHMATTLMVKSIRPAARAGLNVADQDAAAEGLTLWAQAIPGMFPVGSALPGSRARPEIWQNKADFDAKAAAFGEAAARLEVLAKAGDAAGFAPQVEVVQARCSACHKAYRSD
jgi:cytochrome c556